MTPSLTRLGIAVRVAAVAAIASLGAAGAPAVHAESRGPFVALDAAHAAAGKESDRAHAEDATAATLGAATASEAVAPKPIAEGAAGAAAPANAADAVAHPVPPDAAAAQAADASPKAAGGQTGAAPDGATPPANAAVATAEPFTYEPSQHRDPFRPPGLTAPVADATPRTPLERYELGQLKLVGVVSAANGGATRAMVEDSSGLGYIVTTGTPIGSAGGVVTRIEPRRVLIEEHVMNFYGEKEPKEFVMELPKEDRSP